MSTQFCQTIQYFGPIHQSFEKTYIAKTASVKLFLSIAVIHCYYSRIFSSNYWTVLQILYGFFLGIFSKDVPSFWKPIVFLFSMQHLSQYWQIHSCLLELLQKVCMESHNQSYRSTQYSLSKLNLAQRLRCMPRKSSHLLIFLKGIRNCIITTFISSKLHLPKTDQDYQ